MYKEAGVPIMTRGHKEEFAAYYTPYSLAKALCDWAIRDPLDTVLEPSFGGCAFIEAALARLQAVGQADGEACLYGVDIDPSAFLHLKRKTNLSDAQISTQFIEDNFLSVASGAFGKKKFKVAIGNPPYVRRSAIKPTQLKAIEAWESLNGASISRRASLWAYFLQHSLSFLEDGGRVAWVLPGALCTSEYGKNTLNNFSLKFRQLQVIKVSERLFRNDGTDESTVILLADGFGQHKKAAAIEEYEVDSVSALVGHLGGALNVESVGSHGKSFSDLFDSPDVTTLGEHCNILIGLVSGDTNFFVKSRNEWRSLGIPSAHLKYIAPKSRWLKSSVLDASTKAEHIRMQAPCLAFHPPHKPRAKATIDYLASYSSESIKSNATLRKRRDWHRFLEGNPPDGIMIFMGQCGPRILVNDIDALCTNALHRVFLKSDDKALIKILSIATLTTFTQLSAEIVGQAMGSGGLKLDPRNANSLKLYIPKDKTEKEIDDALECVNFLLQTGRAVEARNVADRFIFSSKPCFWDAIEPMSTELAHRRRVRAAGRNYHEDN